MQDGKNPREGAELIDAATARQERLWFGLRTVDGIELSAAEIASIEASRRYAELQEVGYSVLEGGCLRLTESGFLLADALGLELERILEDSDHAAA